MRVGAGFPRPDSESETLGGENPPLHPFRFVLNPGGENPLLHVLLLDQRLQQWHGNGWALRRIDPIRPTENAMVIPSKRSRLFAHNHSTQSDHLRSLRINKPSLARRLSQNTCLARCNRSHATELIYDDESQDRRPYNVGAGFPRPGFESRAS